MLMASCRARCPLCLLWSARRNLLLQASVFREVHRGVCTAPQRVCVSPSAFWSYWGFPPKGVQPKNISVQLVQSCCVVPYWCLLLLRPDTFCCCSTEDHSTRVCEAHLWACIWITAVQVSVLVTQEKENFVKTLFLQRGAGEEPAPRLLLEVHFCRILLLINCHDCSLASWGPSPINPIRVCQSPPLQCSIRYV